jgi:hypothetical protein
MDHHPSAFLNQPDARINKPRQAFGFAQLKIIPLPLNP